MEYRMIYLIKAAIVYALCYLVQGYSYEKPGYLLLSPLLSLDHTTANLLDKHAFLAIGTADPHFSQEK
ncbi:hypothetical protein [Lysinibacillus sphaericus]|uniref:hypothetical protein n=1 Tax=Lysinibacillus sphaericus TaxID=1421 RepID=UPI002DB5C5B5|nr:hypothetical protein [Lysinibacillus sphaericus]MEB7455065.1 hypothetical protein [Lysinibacillus sphaericus]